MMDRARALTIAGIALGFAAVLGLFLALTGGPEEIEPLPRERAAAPTAPSQTPAIPVSVPQDDRGADRPTFARQGVDDSDSYSGDDADDGRDDSDRADGGRANRPAATTPRPAPARSTPSRSAPTTAPSAAPSSAPSSPSALGAPTDLQDRTSQAAPAPAPRRSFAGDGPRFCFDGVIPTTDHCADVETIAALETEAIGVKRPTGETEKLSVALADPDDVSAEPRTARTCQQFLSLKANGWGALTTAGMRRELEMNRFCGLVAMAKRAQPGKGGLSRLTEDALRTIPDDQWPTIGEAPVTNPLILDTPGDPRLWFVQADRVEFTLRDVGAADFDGDGRNEVLVHTALQAADGTAIGGGYMLADQTGNGVTLMPADLY